MTETTTITTSVSSYLSVDTKAFWLDLADRASKTFLQNLLVFLGAGTTLLSVSWLTALSSAGLATLASVLFAFVGSTALTSGNFLIDTGDRVARTFAGSLLAAIPATGGFANVNWKDAATIAATAAVVSLITSLSTAQLGPAKGLPSLAPVTPVIVDVDPETVVDVEYSGDVEYNAGTLGEAGGPVPFNDGRSSDN